LTPDEALIHAILQGGVEAYSHARQKGIKSEHLFGDYKQVYDLFETYLPKGRLPSTSEIDLLTQIEIKEQKDKLDIDTCSTIISNRTLKTSLETGLDAIIRKLEDPVKARLELDQLVIDTAQVKGTIQSTNNPLSIEIIEKRYLEAENAGDKTLGIPSPWPSRDKASLGLHKGELAAILAKRGTGKTQGSLAWINHAWSNYFKNGEKILIISMEMPPWQINSRLFAIHNKLDFAQFRSGKLPPDQKLKFMNWCAEMKKKDDKRSEIIVIGSDLVDTPSDAARYTAQYKPSLVLIDGFYIMGKSSRKPIWERTLENIQMIKLDVAVSQNVPVIVTSQLSGSVGKEDLDGEADSAAYAKAIGDYADTVDGLFADTTFLAQKQRVMRGMKGRDFEPIDLLINFNMSTQDYSEIKVLNSNNDLPGEPSLAIDQLPDLGPMNQIAF